MSEKIEDWETKRRAEYEKTIPEGLHQISAGAFVMWTGKYGRINFEIALEKEGRKVMDIYKAKKDGE